jgi:hypothetical protein
MKKFTTIALSAAVAFFGATAMAQTSQNIDVEIQVENYAELTVLDDDIILHLVDDNDVFSGMNDGTNGKTAVLQLQANYLTNLEVTPGTSGTMVTHHGFTMILTSDNGNELGAWPQITGPDVSGQSLFSSWNGSVLTMDSLHREDGNTAAVGGDGSGPGTGIPAGTHEINVGVSSRLSNTDDGSWAPAGVYSGDLVVTVVDHP